MTKKEIVKGIAEKLGLTQVETMEVVQSTLDAITDAIARQGRIELRNFGVFEVKERAARKARNPRTGEELYVPAKRVVVFKPGRLLEEQVAALAEGPTPTLRPLSEVFDVVPSRKS